MNNLLHRGKAQGESVEHVRFPKNYARSFKGYDRNVLNSYASARSSRKVRSADRQTKITVWGQRLSRGWLYHKEL
ncbi:hypothetical protein PBN151_1442 [Paenibacillus sp. NAIST15-1]|nr:hypothetical protein PBN151_1442 [Paenibacillus sp. NAIST15-1]